VDGRSSDWHLDEEIMSGLIAASAGQALSVADASVARLVSSAQL
jgi:hypothetical protein